MGPEATLLMWGLDLQKVTEKKRHAAAFRLLTQLSLDFTKCNWMRTDGRNLGSQACQAPVVCISWPWAASYHVFLLENLLIGSLWLGSALVSEIQPHRNRGQSLKEM